MSSSHKPDWLLKAHPEIFDKIMMMVVLSSVESLHRCRQVCRTWNAMIMENIWENPSKRIIIKMRIEKIWGPDIDPYPDYIFYAKWKGKSRWLLILKESMTVSVIETRGILDKEMRIEKNWEPRIFPSDEDISHAKWLGKS